MKPRFVLALFAVPLSLLASTLVAVVPAHAAAGRTVWVGLPNERQIAAVDAATLR
jgi:hypothetical protein